MNNNNIKNVLHEHREKVAKRSVLVNLFSFWFLMAGTAGFVLIAIFPKLISFGMTLVIANVLAALIALLVSKILDGTLKDTLPATVAILLSVKDKKMSVETKPTFDIVTVILCIVSISGSVLLNYKINPELVNTTVSSGVDNKISRYQAEVATQQNRVDNELKHYNTEISSAQKNYDKILSTENDRILSYISVNANKEISRLYKSGKNDWIYTPDCSGCKAAIKKSIKLAKDDTEKALSLLTQAKEDKRKYLDTQGKTANTLIASKAESMDEIKESAASTKVLYTSIIDLILLFSAIGYIGTTVIIQYHQIDTGRDFSSDVTLFNMFERIWIRVQYNLLYWPSKWFMLFQPYQVEQLATATLGIIPNTSTLPKEKEDRKEDTEAQENRETQKNTEKGDRNGSDDKKEEKEEDRGGSDDLALAVSTPVDNGDGTYIYNSETLKGFIIDTNTWVTPGHKDWDKFVKRARGWFKQIFEGGKAITKEKNKAKWLVFEEFCPKHGYYACGNFKTKGCVVHEQSIIMKDNYSGEWNVPGVDDGDKFDRDGDLPY